jgi:serralysin
VIRRSARFLLVLTACAAATSVTPSAQALPPTELLGTGGPVIPLKNAAMIDRTPDGYRYRAGQQNSHLTITKVDGKLLYRDTGTRELRGIPGSCSRRSVPTGIAALCSIPVLADAGNDTVLGGAGDDFVNGAHDTDRVWGGPGNDWIRGGSGNDRLYGGTGNDRLLGQDGADIVRGGAGTDRVER